MGFYGHGETNSHNLNSGVAGPSGMRGPIGGQGPNQGGRPENVYSNKYIAHIYYHLAVIEVEMQYPVM